VESFLSRKEIRRRVLSRMGKSSNDAQAQQVMEPVNELIRAAAQAIFLRCNWVQTITETTATVGIDQTVLNYPENCQPQNVVSIAYWDESAQKYVPLRRGSISAEMVDDPLVEVGEPDSVAGRSSPRIYQLRGQIEIWPRPDQEYSLRIEHSVNPDLENDDSVSVVDAESIVLHVMAECYDFDGDKNLADIKRGQYEQRVQTLIGQQAPIMDIRRGRLDRARFSKVQTGYVPNSGNWPAVMP